LVTLNLFIRFGSSNAIGIREIIAVKVNWNEIKKIVLKNWAFIIISSLSVVNWKLGNVIVSKVLTLKDVTVYEVSFKLFSIAYILPIIVSQSVYPMLIEAYKSGIDKMSRLYHQAFLPLCIYGFLAFTFTYAYADHLIPWIFGEKYLDTAKYCKEMFLVMLIFPSIFLQANVMLTLKLEKIDMICNIASVSLNVLISVIGLYYVQSLSVVNYAIFFSFLGFHLIQDYILIQKKVTDLKHVLMFYLFTTAALVSYWLLCNQWNKEIIFPLFWMVIGPIIFYFYRRDHQRKKDIEMIEPKKNQDQ
jgi:O-antigen/teichoic acid export membrane protein